MSFCVQNVANWWVVLESRFNISEEIVLKREPLCQHSVAIIDQMKVLKKGEHAAIGAILFVSLMIIKTVLLSPKHT